jgi:acetylornithine aminotransferase
VRPDIVTLAKGLGGGLPIGACVGFGPTGELFAKGDHGSTFGGNPVSCAAALAVLDTIERDGLLESVRAVGARLADGLRSIDSPLVRGVRGGGLWLALVLTRPVAAEVEAAARRGGLLVNAVQPDAIRLAPPLVLSARQADAAVRGLRDAVVEVEPAVTVGAASAAPGGDTTGAASGGGAHQDEGVR